MDTLGKMEPKYKRFRKQICFLNHKFIQKLKFTYQLRCRSCWNLGWQFSFVLLIPLIKNYFVLLSLDARYGTSAWVGVSLVTDWVTVRLVLPIGWYYSIQCMSYIKSVSTILKFRFFWNLESIMTSLVLNIPRNWSNVCHAFYWMISSIC